MKTLVHGLPISSDMLNKLKDYSDVCVNSCIECFATNQEQRDNIISLLSSYGYDLKSEYKLHRLGWNITTLGKTK